MKELYKRLDIIAEQYRRGWMTVTEADRLMSTEIEAAHGMACAENWEHPAIDKTKAYRRKYRLLMERTAGR